MRFLIILFFLTGCTTEVIDEDIDMNRYGLPGWSASGDLVTFSKDSQVRAQAQMEAPQEFTVSFAVRRGVDTRFIMPQAIINWFVAGNQVQRKVSITDGLSLSGVGLNPAVTAYDNLEAGMTGTPGNSYGLAVTIAPGTRPSQNQPPSVIPDTYTLGAGQIRYQFVVDVPTTGTVIFPVTPGSGAISASISLSYRNPASAAIIDNSKFLIEQLDFASGVTRAYHTLDDYVALTPGTRNIRVTNIFGDDLFVSCLFGVDG